MSSSSRLAAHFAIADSAAEYNLTALADAALTDVTDGTDGFTRNRTLDSGEVADSDGLGEAGPEFAIALISLLDDSTYYADVNSPPTDADRLAIAGEVFEVVTEAIGSSDGSEMADTEKDSLLGDLSEAIAVSLDQAGFSDADIVAYSDDLNGVVLENLEEAGYSDDRIIAVVAEMSEGAAAGFVTAAISDALADDYMNNLAETFTGEFVAYGFTADQINSAAGEFLEGAAEGSEMLGTNDSAAEGSAFIQGLVEKMDGVTGVDIDMDAVKDDIEAGYVASGMTTADAQSIEDTMGSYDPDTMAPDTSKIDPDTESPVEETQG